MGRPAPKLILAAGGIVLGAGIHRDKIAIVRRRRYANEVALPKGKLKTKESPERAARREVLEETGFKAKIKKFAGTTRYSVSSAPKIVFYYLMNAVGEKSTRRIDAKEIEAVEWRTPASALTVLTHQEDRDLVSTAFGIGKEKRAALARPIRNAIVRIFGTPGRDRLANAISEVRIELDSAQPKALKQPWARTTNKLLKEAADALANRNLQAGWVFVQSAQRALLADPDKPERVIRAATALKEEISKITGWRAKAILELIANPHGKLRSNLSQKDTAKKKEVRERVIDALAIRDDYFNTTYFKIALRRHHLLWLFLLITSSVLLCMILAYRELLPGPFDKPKLVAAVILFGVLGAIVSVAQSLMASDISAKLPAQQISAFLVWMRPGIGAASALIAFVLLHANDKLRILDTNMFSPKSEAVVLTIAFLAGYSERFIVGALEKVSQAAGKTDSKK